MRRFIFIAFIAAGGLVGWISAVQDDWAVGVVMSGVGALFGAAIGGALALGGRRRPNKLRLATPIPGMGISTADIAANHWRDKGRPPFTRPPVYPDKHAFDPDKLG